MEISVYSTLDWITGYALIVTALLIYLMGDRSPSAIACSLLSLTTGIWSCLIAISISITNVLYQLFLIKTCHLFGTLISSFFLLFSITYVYNNVIKRQIIYLVWVFEIVFAYILYTTNWIIRYAETTINAEHVIWHYGQYLIIFNLYFAACWIVGISLIINKYKKSSHELTQRSQFLMLLALVIGVLPPTIVTLLLPQINFFDFYWMGPISSLGWISIVTFLISRHNLFHVKIVIAKFATLVLWVIICVRIIFANSIRELLLESLLLIIAIVIGTLLIRTVHKETEQRKRMEDMADELKHSYTKTLFRNSYLSKQVSKQTNEIKFAYLAEKKARLALEKLNDEKNQFIMIMQHNMRSPIRNIMRQLKFYESETSDDINMKLSSDTVIIKSSADRLLHIADNLLDITTIRANSSVLNISRCNLKKIIHDVVRGFKYEIFIMKIKVQFDNDVNIQPESGWLDMFLDKNKIREAMGVIIENAIRYNVPNGIIRISVCQIENQNLLLQIVNSGIGIPEDELKIIGSALFYRGKYAQKAYPIGMGIGLSVVKTIIHAHRGKFSIKSDGINNGAVVEIILPINPFPTPPAQLVH